MDLTDFLVYPEYFPLLMIGVSGYVFVYSVFHETSAWKKLDSTMKLISAFFMGFAIEMGIVLPFFYLDIRNLQVPLLFPAFEKTWIANIAITGIVSFIFATIKERNKLYKLLRLSFYPLLYWYYLIMLFCNLLFLVEYAYFYPLYLINANFQLINYFFRNIFFSILGWFICYVFAPIIDAVFEETFLYEKRGHIFIGKKPPSKWDRRLFLFKVKVKEIAQSNKRFVPLLFIVLISASVIPIDTNYHLFTPKVLRYEPPSGFDKKYAISINAMFKGYYKEPSLNIDCLQKTYETVSYTHLTLPTKA